MFEHLRNYDSPYYDSRRFESRLKGAEDIAGVYAMLADKTVAMWDADKMLLEMHVR